MLRYTINLILVFIAVNFLFTAFSQPRNFEIEKHHLASENFLDFKAYQPLPYWFLEWAEVKNGLLGTAGSISMDIFYFYYQLRLNTELLPFFSIGYNQTEESFLRSEIVFQQMEFRFGKDWFGSIIGWPDHQKKHDQLGIAFGYGLNYSPQYIKVSYINQAHLYNEKNDSDEKNIGKEYFARLPFKNSLEGQYIDKGKLFIQLKWEAESEAEWVNQATELRHIHKSVNKQMSLMWWYNEHWLLGLKYYSDSENQRQECLYSKVCGDGKFQILDLTWLDLYTEWKIQEKGRLIIGYQYNSFSNKIQSDQAIDNYDHFIKQGVFHTTYQIRAGDQSDWIVGILGGQVDLQTLNSEGSNQEELEKESNFQAKFKLGFQLFNLENTRVFFNSTWELDNPGQKAWDGGNMQVSTVF